MGTKIILNQEYLREIIQTKSVSDAYQEIFRSSVTPEILRFLYKTNRPVTITEILKEVKVSFPNACKCLLKLKNYGLVSSKKGSPNKIKGGATPQLWFIAGETY